MKKKLIIVVGARPQFIKLSPLFEILRDKLDLVVVHTGQHYDFEMSDLFFGQLRLPEPDFFLGIGSAENTVQTGRMLIALDDVLKKEKPASVAVIGDTNSTLAGALAAAQRNLQLIHIEAGLRSLDKHLPEQINRVVTDRLADLLCCPTPAAKRNLELEGIIEGVRLTGDILYDLVNKFKPSPQDAETIALKYGLNPGGYFYLTTHRAENVDNIEFLRMLIDELCLMEEKVFFPIHPRTSKNLQKYDLYEKLRSATNIVISKPVGIIESLALTRTAKGVITDSGGLQREAAYFGKRTWLLRQETEWVELVDCGSVVCGGACLPPPNFAWDEPHSPGDEYFKNAAPSIAEAILESLEL